MRARGRRNGAAVSDSAPPAKDAKLFHPAMRRGARVSAFVAVFASIFNDEADLFADADFPVAADSPPAAEFDRAYRDRIVRCFVDREEEIEAAVRNEIDRPFVAVGGAEKAALYTATAELLGCPETPRRVVISEAIEIARLYGDDGADKFVNGVLDPVARALAAAKANLRWDE